MNSIDVCGVLVHVQPTKVYKAEAVLNTMQGVEVHAATEDGRMVVTIEEVAGEQLITQTIDSFNDVDGVLSASLVYHHSESVEGN